jgi:hypothetical protein
MYEVCGRLLVPVAQAALVRNGRFPVIELLQIIGTILRAGDLRGQPRKYQRDRATIFRSIALCVSGRHQLASSVTRRPVPSHFLRGGG